MTSNTLAPGSLGSLAGLTITKVADRPPFMNILIYGNSGIGKTRLAGSADALPLMRPVLFVDVEGGTETLRSSYPDVHIVRVKTWTDIQNLYNVLYDGNHPYQTVVLDSLTEIQKFNMYNIMYDLVEKDPARDPDIPSVREWGKSIEQMRRFVRAFRDLPMHTIFTALDRVEKDDRTGVRLHMPAMSGKLSGEVAAFLDVVMYYYVKEIPDPENENQQKTIRLLLTQSSEEFTAKDRTGNLPQLVPDPTMSTLFDLMYPTETPTKVKDAK